MTSFPQRLGLLCVLLCCLVVDSRGEDGPNVDKRFADLIPSATAVDAKLFLQMATSEQGPRPDMFTEHSLTAELMMFRIEPIDPEEEKKRQFRYLGRTPKPSKLAAEMYRTIGAGNFRVVTHPCTMVQAERITRCEAEVEGERAQGSFDFHVPELYEGSANFVAKKTSDDKWKITEIEMKTVGIHIARDEKGKWQRVNKQKEQ